jgi:hypothetical protein
MRTWWAHNAEHREPKSNADAAEFGLDFERVRPQFASYVEHARRWTARATREG